MSSCCFLLFILSTARQQLWCHCNLCKFTLWMDETVNNVLWNAWANQDFGWSQNWLHVSWVRQGPNFFFCSYSSRSIFLSPFVLQLITTVSKSSHCHACCDLPHAMTATHKPAHTYKTCRHSEQKKTLVFAEDSKYREYNFYRCCRVHSWIHKHCQQAKWQSNQIQMHTCYCVVHPLCATRRSPRLWPTNTS